MSNSAGGIIMRCYCHAIESSVLGRSVPVRFIVPVGDNLPCLVLLHGYNGDHNQWFEKSNITQIAEMYHLAVILPGCGNGYYEDTVEDIPSFIGYELMIYAKKNYLFQVPEIEHSSLVSLWVASAQYLWVQNSIIFSGKLHPFLVPL